MIKLNATKHLYVALAGAFLLNGAATAAVLDFESGLDPAFTYSGVSTLTVPESPGSGYDNVAAFSGSSGVAFNPFAVSPSSFMIAGGPTTTFTLNSFVIAGAWGTQTLLIEGLNDGSVLDTSSLGVSPAAQTFNAGWSGIDELRITIGSDFVQNGDLGGTGQHWALDNLTYNAAPIPEPETYAMLLAGLGLLGFVARRRKQQAAA